MNVTAVPPIDGWAGYVAEAQKYLPPPSRLALLCLINVPILAVVLNVLRQLVSLALGRGICRGRVKAYSTIYVCRSCPATSRCLPKFSTGFLLLVQHRSMAMIHSSFSSNAGRRFVQLSLRWYMDTCNIDVNERVSRGTQYGEVFTFILFGRKVTVALGAKGNNFVLGGKVAHLSAEDAYTVCGIRHVLSHPDQSVSRILPPIHTVPTNCPERSG